MTTEIVVKRRDGVQIIVIDRPEKKNALNLAMYRAMTAAISQASEDRDIRVVLLQGHDDCFTSGNDLVDFANLVAEPDKLNSPDNPILQFMKALERCPKPVLAAVNGSSVGIGTTMLLHCDLVYCGPSASFSLPFANLGLCPEYACSYLLPRLVGHVKAAEWLYLGESFDGAAALEAGLVNAVVENVEAHAEKVCNKLLLQPPAALRQTKALLKAATRGQVAESMDNEIRDFVSALAGPEFSEAVSAFFEKRTADFSRCR